MVASRPITTKHMSSGCNKRKLQTSHSSFRFLKFQIAISLVLSLSLLLSFSPYLSSCVWYGHSKRSWQVTRARKWVLLFITLTSRRNNCTHVGFAVSPCPHEPSTLPVPRPTYLVTLAHSPRASWKYVQRATTRCTKSSSLRGRPTAFCLNQLACQLYAPGCWLPRWRVNVNLFLNWRVEECDSDVVNSQHSVETSIHRHSGDQFPCHVQRWRHRVIVVALPLLHGWTFSRHSQDSRRRHDGFINHKWFFVSFATGAQEPGALRFQSSLAPRRLGPPRRRDRVHRLATPCPFQMAPASNRGLLIDYQHRHVCVHVTHTSRHLLIWFYRWDPLWLAVARQWLMSERAESVLLVASRGTDVDARFVAGVDVAVVVGWVRFLFVSARSFDSLFLLKHNLHLLECNPCPIALAAKVRVRVRESGSESESESTLNAKNLKP